MTGPQTEPVRVVVVNGSPREQSTTMGLVDVVLEALADRMLIDVHRADVYRLGTGLTAASGRDEVSADVEKVLLDVEGADLLIAATPVFRGSYTGMFKHFFDLVDQYALASTPVLLAATGGGSYHALVLEHALRPLFGFFQSLVLPVAVFASAADFDGTLLLAPRVRSRAELAAAEAARLLSVSAIDEPVRSPLDPPPVG
ncbi:NAD(P)H-dependent oxidoreductase [Pseudonocardia tropica]|uniref:NAD(P)H-dependent oxidoreductase n=1 Tax=Pseudonocardia tropica TaxID=681289 RepID=A0ABV1K4C2_9PSEU